jgi:hypothetical protein
MSFFQNCDTVSFQNQPLQLPAAVTVSATSFLTFCRGAPGAALWESGGSGGGSGGGAAAAAAVLRNAPL